MNSRYPVLSMTTSPSTADAGETVGMPGQPSARATTVGALTAEDFARWRRLESRAAEPYPYLSADYLEPADPHWPAALAVRLLLVEDGDDLLLVMPFRVGPYHPRLPLRVLSTADAVLSDEGIRTYPLVDAERGREALRVAFASLRSLGLPRVIDMPSIPADGTLHRLLIDALPSARHSFERGRAQLAVARYAGSTSERASVDVDVEPHHRSTSSRKQSRQRRRALERELGAEIQWRDRSEDPAVIDDFLTLQAAGWKGDADQHGLAYRLTGRDQWFREVTARARADGRLVAYEIYTDGSPLYIAVLMSAGPTIFGLQDAYDQTRAAHRVGNLGRVALTNWLASSAYDMFDPNMYWSYVESARLFADRREQVRLVIAASGLWSRTQLGLARSISRAQNSLGAARERLSTMRIRRTES